MPRSSTSPAFPVRRRLVALAALLAFAIATLSIPAHAMPSVSLVRDDLVSEIRRIVSDEIVTMSVTNHNERYGNIPQSEIERLDRQWVEERKASKKPLISATLANPLSNYLTRVQAHSVGLIVEIIVFNRLGLNVGQSSITSDFWQGDEKKFQRTFPNGPNALFIDEPEFDEETKTWRVQVNVSVPDREHPDTVIGAATFEINLTELERRVSQ